MRILILDERKGQEITPEIETQISVTDIVLMIAMDNKVSVDVKCDPDTEVAHVISAYIELPHRDELSGAESASSYAEIEKRRGEADKKAEPAMAKAKRALAPTMQ